jgi:hypothetical protein
MRIFLILNVIGLGLLLGAPVASNAQDDQTISVSGTVESSLGAVPHATITVKVIECKCSDCKNSIECACCPNQLTVDTDDKGKFAFSVPHGTYAVEVRAGSRKAELTLDLNEGDKKTVTVTVH